MANRPKQIGTAAETAVVRTARAHGFPHADRLTLTGVLDRGDVGLCPGVIVEVKGGELARNASDALIESWLHETARERANARAVHAFLVVQRRGVGAPNAHRWWAWWRLADLAAVIEGFDLDLVLLGRIPVRMLLGDALQLLRAAGFGDPLETDASRDVSGRGRARVASGAAS